MYVVNVIAGLVIVAVAVFEWVSHISLQHAIAILTAIVGVAVALGGVRGIERGAVISRHRQQP